MVFLKTIQINVFDNNYVNTLETPIFTQYYNGQNTKLHLEVKDNCYITDKRTLIPYIQLENLLFQIKLELVFSSK